MKRSLNITALSLALLALASPAVANDGETHSVYKVTTYNLGALFGGQHGSDFSMQSFEPLMITSSKADILNDQQLQTDHLNGTGTSANPLGFAISAEYSATPQLALQGVFGITQTPSEPSAFNNLSSWEANLGVIYKFLDNLSYEIHFGYMETGDLFSERNSYSDVESIIMISNKLTMSF